MIELLRIVLDTGLFFIACTIIFLVGFVIDARVQVRRAARAGTESPGRRAKPRGTLGTTARA